MIQGGESDGMEWCDEGVVIGIRRHGETSVIVELLTPARGRHLGMVLGGRSRRLRPVLQPGNSVVANWRARLDDHMGHYTVEALRLRAAGIIDDALALHALNHLCVLVRLLPERDPHPALHDDLAALLDRLGERETLPAMIVRFELRLLADLGFGLDLDRCAATGRCDDLAYVSPRTGRAVSRAAGAPYRDRILALPSFLTASADGPAALGVPDLQAGFRLTEYFLKRNVFAPRGLALPDARRAYLAALFAA
ncbi:MAG TPA: DNA repair protein RecO [Lichenihabitans sp.]|nr:DNA repair protein RecO [Lichenihabitans sp.]